MLTHAEQWAIKTGLLHTEGVYRKLFSGEFRQCFGKYSITVGSTGNLGVSIGIMGLLARKEQIRLEPSALAGMPVPWQVTADRAWQANKGLNEATLARATHLVCATDGGMVPAQEMEKYLATTNI